jgi:quercetin dioxygenase-like cupin family protein
VTFEPCARSDWHTHPLGQTLIVTFGCGLHQRWGGPVEEIRPGDVVTVGPNEKHWHGAAPTTSMTHIAIQEALDGKRRGLTRRTNIAPNPEPGLTVPPGPLSDRRR